MATATHDEQVAADQAAIDEARAELSETGEQDETEVLEQDDGQLAITGPGTEPKFSTDAGGSPPHTAELVLKSSKHAWDTDLRRGSSLLLLVHAYVPEVLIGAKKVFPSEVVSLVEVDTGEMTPYEAMKAEMDFRSRADYDRAVIDHAATLAQEILDADAATNGLELAEALRTQLYERYHVDDDAHEATHGTEDHEEAEEPQEAAV